jgi:hypothetical protein
MKRKLRFEAGSLFAMFSGDATYRFLFKHNSNCSSPLSVLFLGLKCYRISGPGFTLPYTFRALVQNDPINVQ